MKYSDDYLLGMRNLKLVVEKVGKSSVIFYEEGR